MMKRSHVISINRIEVGLSIKKKLDALKMAVLGRVMKRCGTVRINSIDLGALIKQMDEILSRPVFCSSKKLEIKLALCGNRHGSPFNQHQGSK